MSQGTRKQLRRYLVANMRWFEKRKHCLTASFSLLKFVSLLLEVLGLSDGIWIKLPVKEIKYN
jgi:hypothetical protein